MDESGAFRALNVIADLPVCTAFVSTACVCALTVARVASGEHWLSDVLGGLLLGVIWLQVIIAALGARRRSRA